MYLLEAPWWGAPKEYPQPQHFFFFFDEQTFFQYCLVKENHLIWIYELTVTFRHLDVLSICLNNQKNFWKAIKIQRIGYQNVNKQSR